MQKSQHVNISHKSAGCQSTQTHRLETVSGTSTSEHSACDILTQPDFQKEPDLYSYYKNFALTF